MYAQVEKKKENKTRTVAHSVAQKKRKGELIGMQKTLKSGNSGNNKNSKSTMQRILVNGDNDLTKEAVYDLISDFSYYGDSDKVGWCISKAERDTNERWDFSYYEENEFSFITAIVKKYEVDWKDYDKKQKKNLGNEKKREMEKQNNTPFDAGDIQTSIKKKWNAKVGCVLSSVFSVLGKGWQVFDEKSAQKLHEKIWENDSEYEKYRNYDGTECLKAIYEVAGLKRVVYSGTLDQLEKGVKGERRIAELVGHNAPIYYDGNKWVVETVQGQQNIANKPTEKFIAYWTKP